MPDDESLVWVKDENLILAAERLPTVHDLFNELHQRLVVRAEKGKDQDTANVADHLDALHHTYTDICD